MSTKKHTYNYLLYIVIILTTYCPAHIVSMEQEKSMTCSQKTDDKEFYTLVSSDKQETIIPAELLRHSAPLKVLAEERMNGMKEATTKTINFEDLSHNDVDNLAHLLRTRKQLHGASTTKTKRSLRKEFKRMSLERLCSSTTLADRFLIDDMDETTITKTWLNRLTKSTILAQLQTHQQFEDVLKILKLKKISKEQLLDKLPEIYIGLASSFITKGPSEAPLECFRDAGVSETDKLEVTENCVRSKSTKLPIIKSTNRIRLSKNGKCCVGIQNNQICYWRITKTGAKKTISVPFPKNYLEEHFALSKNGQYALLCTEYDRSNALTTYTIFKTYTGIPFQSYKNTSVNNPRKFLFLDKTTFAIWGGHYSHAISEYVMESEQVNHTLPKLTRKNILYILTVIHKANNKDKNINAITKENKKEFTELHMKLPDDVMEKLADEYTSALGQLINPMGIDSDDESDSDSDYVFRKE